MLEIKNIITEIKNAFDGLISRLDSSEERISELVATATGTSKTENQKEQIWKEQQQNIQGLWDSYKKYDPQNRNHKRRKGRERKRRNIWKNND